MGYLSNTWLNYVDRPYQLIKEQVLTAMQARVPEITDDTESNIFVKMIDIWAAMCEMLGYYTDNAAREAFIDSCRLYASAISIAKLMDYRVRGCSPASVQLTFTINVPAPTPIDIPAGTQAQTQDGITFYTVADATIPVGQTFVLVNAIQTVAVPNVPFGNADGSIGFTVTMTPDVEDSSVSLTVNSIAWNSQETLGFSGPTSTDFVGTLDENQNYIVYFGDNIQGEAPAAGDPIVISYRSTQGALGNVAAGTITIIPIAIGLPNGVASITVTNVNASSGGSDAETIAQLAYRIPLSIRTLNRAVTHDDYENVAELCNGVALAGVEFSCGKSVSLYIVPDGGGIASGTLLSAVQAWMDDRKMITTEVDVYSAGEIHVQLVISVNVLANYNQAAVQAAVLANLIAFMSYQNQQVNGQVQLSSIYKVVEDTEGVNYSNVSQMVAIPYANPLNTTTPTLVWNVAINPTSNATVQWQIIIVSATQYQLLKNGNYVGTFNFGVPQLYPEVTFNITYSSAYAIGNQWEFTTYSYFGTLILAEPSLPVSVAGDITLQMSGGI